MIDHHAAYRKQPDEQPTYQLGPVRALLAEHDYLFSIFDADVTVLGGPPSRMVLAVPVAISAVSFSVALALTEEDAQMIDAGEFAAVTRLANAVKRDFSRFRTFPAPPQVQRFIM